MNENQDGDKIIEAWLYDSLQPYKSDIAFGITEWRVFLEISGFGKKFVIQALINQDIIAQKEHEELKNGLHQPKLDN